jgi:hypothetical protein
MRSHREHDDRHTHTGFHHEDSHENLAHKKEVRQRLENRLELKRLKDELEYFDGELDDEFDWSYFNAKD